MFQEEERWQQEQQEQEHQEKAAFEEELLERRRREEDEQRRRDEDERRRHHQLISGEMAKPTEAFKMISDQALRPLFNSLFEDLRSVLPDDMEEERLSLNIFSVFAMVLYFNFAQPVISSFTGCDYDAAFKERLVDHIVEFSLNGLGAESKETSK